MAVVHLIHHPVSAKKLVEPIVRSLNENGIEAELWIENRKEVGGFISAIGCPKSFGWFDLSVNPFTVLIRLVQLSIRFLRIRPRAVHAHQARAAFIPLLAAAIARVPTRIYHNRGAPYLGYRGLMRALLKLLEVLNCRLATHVLSVSPSIRRKMIEDSIVQESKCVVLGKGSACGIDLDRFAPSLFDGKHKAEARNSLGIALDAYVVLYVGRPVMRKGFHLLLESWRSLSSAAGRQTLLIAGCTPEDVARAVGSPIANVIALGYVQDVRPYYAACDVVVLPSWHEGFPYALLEGAAAGRPLVGSDIPGVDSVITGNNGILIPPRNARALCEALIALRGNPDLRTEMGRLGRRYVERYFDRKIVNGLLLNYYDKIGLNGHDSSLASSI